mgnify:CR=1 FL=1
MKIEQELIVNFILGGTIVSLITYTAKYMDKKISAVIWSFPTLLVASLCSMWYMKMRDTELNELAVTCLPSLFLGFVWLITFIMFMKKYEFTYSLIYTILIWCVVAFIFYKFDIFNIFKNK